MSCGARHTIPIATRRGRGVTPRSRCGCASWAAPRRCPAAPACRARRRRSRCWTSARSAWTAPSACAAPPPAPRPPASRASPAPAGTRSPRGSAHHTRVSTRPVRRARAALTPPVLTHLTPTTSITSQVDQHRCSYSHSQNSLSNLIFNNQLWVEIRF